MKAKVRKSYGTDKVESMGNEDKQHKEYCESLDNFLNKCECEVNLTCEKCAPEDHEGHFCRCEGRNISIAKYLRSKDLSPWQKPADNKGEGESHADSSKREDGINTLRCGNCEKYFDIFLDPNHAYRCGARNSDNK
jgi:hypothetical protein